jgi:hypothetical protein
MKRYAGYGLCIQSELDLPELVPAAGAIPDVTIQWGKTGRARPERECANGYFEIQEADAYLFWDRVGGFRVRGGRDVIVEPLPDVEERLLRLPLLGMVMGALLQQRGILALHGSAVSIEGQAIALVGYSGAGKSTLAAALHARGHAILTDDLIAIDREPGGPPVVLPAYPQLKLCPESAAASLGDDPETLPLLATGVFKRARRSAAGFSLQPLPLTRVYILSRGETTELMPLDPQAAMLELIRHSYAIRIFRRSHRGAAAVHHLRQCTQIVNHALVRRLQREHRLDAVSALAQWVEEDVPFSGETAANLALAGSARCA